MCKSKDRQHNGEQKKVKRTNNDLENRKVKIEKRKPCQIHKPTNFKAENQTQHVKPWDCNQQ